jgi:membrane-bound lytic murein transglycosylase D
LKQYEIPEDFKYLAVAESILYDKARSPVGAGGVWQLMKGTARDYGLEVNDNVDERYNLVLSTHAACQFLVESYAKYENWTLVAASYNMGRRALSRSLKYSKQDDYYNMYLNSETARYVYRILAFKLVIESPDKYGFSVEEKDKFPVFKCDTVMVDYPIKHIADFALEQNMTYKTLKLFNPWFLENHLNNASKKKYKVLVPKKGYRLKK